VGGQGRHDETHASGASGDRHQSSPECDAGS
jgi:hypothetical protein